MATRFEVLAATVDFEYFRGWLVEGLGYGDGSKGGRPPFDPVSMFKVLILQTQHNLSGQAHGVHDPRPAVLDAVFLGLISAGRRRMRTRSGTSATA